LEWGLSPDEIASAYIAREYRTAHNGVTHLTYRQAFDGIEVVNVLWKINIDRDGAVINTGGRLVKLSSGVKTPGFESGPAAVRAAVQAVNPSIDGSYVAAAQVKGERYMRFARGGFANELKARPVWYSADGALRPAWVVAVPGENGTDRHSVIVDAEFGRVLHRRNLTLYQAAQPPARGLVFERESPQPNPTPGQLTGPRPYVERTVQPFTGDPVASPRGWVDGTQTVGNNVTAGQRREGFPDVLSPRFIPAPTTAPDRNFSFPLQLGPGAPNPTNFPDAATSNLFYWANVAHDRFYALGFDEAAGNFQEDNFGRGGVGGDAVYAFSQFGVAAPNIALIDNAQFGSDFEDGSRAIMVMYLSGSFGERIFTDGSYDAGVILHEYTHGVSTRLSQDVYDTEQGAAMGEGWSDYFGLEFTVPQRANPNGIYTVGEYFFQQWDRGIRFRPYSTNLEVNPASYADYGRIAPTGSEVHADGEIWAQALWDARSNLIAQLGEAEGRKRMATLILDGMKLSPPRASMVDARDGIILADRVNYRGESQSQLWAAFARRGLGATAFTSSGDSSSPSSSAELPSRAGLLRFEWPRYNMAETVRLVLHDSNNSASTALVQLTTSSGDLENLLLRRQGETFTGTIPMGTDGIQGRSDGALDVIPGDFMSAYYVDRDTGAGSKLIETTVATSPGYTFTRQSTQSAFRSGTERALFTAPQGRQFLSTALVSLPFSFRYFGRDYRTVFVSSEGFISLGRAPASTCGDEQSFATAPIIAPLWMEMFYGGQGQRDENVYYSTSADSVTFRWAAETVRTGQPVNVSLVLSADGRIMFQYGEGNNNLVSSSTFGCRPQTPFIGLTNGRGTLMQAFQDYAGVPNLNAAPTVIVDPPFNYSSLPVVHLDLPEPGGAYSGVLTISGVAYDQNDRIARIDVLIDGVPRRVVMPTLPRTDFCNQQRVPGCPTVGFRTVVDLAALGLDPGEHTVQLRATNSRGAIVNHPNEPFRVTVGPGQSSRPEGQIEVPAEGVTLSETTSIRGWAYSGDLRITAVDILINGVTYGRATYGQRRDDVCQAVQNRPPNCPNVGFTFNLNTLAGRIQLPNGEAFLQARAQDESGRFTLIPETPIRVTIGNTEPGLAPRGVINSPVPNSTVRGTIKIWGWAWDPDGTIQTARLIIDGITFATLEYGEERAAQCAALTDVPACPNIGFSADFDTTRLSNGLHQLGVQLTDNLGRTSIIPALGRFGMNVFVDNPTN